MLGSTINNSVVNNKDNHVYDSGNTITNSFNPTFNIGNTTGNVTVMRPRAVSEMEEMSKRLKEDERYEILTWLSEVDYEQHHKFISSARQENTGNWLVEKHGYIEWTNSKSGCMALVRFFEKT
ncbi:hypothetical protein RUND412_010460 [Rhizina undulata]